MKRDLLGKKSGKQKQMIRANVYSVVKKSEIEKSNKQDNLAWTKSVIDKNE